MRGGWKGQMSGGGGGRERRVEGGEKGGGWRVEGGREEEEGRVEGERRGEGEELTSSNCPLISAARALDRHSLDPFRATLFRQ
jgi:hypothetical protein